MKLNARLLSLWESTRTSYWFIPSLMIAGALGLSFLMLELDVVTPHAWMNRIPWLYTGSPQGARSILSAVAGSMISLAGVVFSITIVALTLASNQFGPRLLRNFMRDLGNQVVLGSFVSTFLYCLMVLRQIHGDSDPAGAKFIPHLSMLMAILLAVIDLGVLIYFIHHTAASIQAPSVVATVARELHGAINELYPEKLGDAPDEEDESSQEARRQAESRMKEAPAIVPADRAGYLQILDGNALMSQAREHDLIIRVEHRPGQYLQADDAVLRIWPASRAPEQTCHQLRQAFTINAQRTLAQDAEYAFDQLVEIASRTLSPGINDPFTAMQCVDRLGEALSHLAQRVIPSPYRMDDQGCLRVIAYPLRFCNFAEAAFNQVRQDSARSLSVMLRLLEAITRVAARVRRGDDRVCLAEHGKMVYEQAMGVAGTPLDQKAVIERYARLTHALDPDSALASDPGGNR